MSHCKLVIHVPSIDDGQQCQVLMVLILHGMSSLGEYLLPPLASYLGWGNNRYATQKFVDLFVFCSSRILKSRKFGDLTNLSHILSYLCFSLGLRGLPNCQLSHTMMLCAFSPFDFGNVIRIDSVGTEFNRIPHRSQFDENILAL
jgi:hypothetical protein